MIRCQVTSQLSLTAIRLTIIWVTQLPLVMQHRWLANSLTHLLLVAWQVLGWRRMSWSLPPSLHAHPPAQRLGYRRHSKEIQVYLLKKKKSRKVLICIYGENIVGSISLAHIYLDWHVRLNSALLSLSTAPAGGNTNSLCSDSLDGPNVHCRWRCYCSAGHLWLFSFVKFNDFEESGQI